MENLKSRIDKLEGKIFNSYHHKTYVTWNQLPKEEQDEILAYWIKKGADIEQALDVETRLAEKYWNGKGLGMTYRSAFESTVPVSELKRVTEERYDIGSTPEPTVPLNKPFSTSELFEAKKAWEEKEMKRSLIRRIGSGTWKTIKFIGKLIGFIFIGIWILGCMLIGSLVGFVAYQIAVNLGWL